MGARAVPNRVMIVAGEASGDLHGARLVRAMRNMAPALEFCGIGGPRMAAEGVRLRFAAERLAVVGITEVFARLADVSAGLAAAKGLLKRARPALLILIDFPDFNLRVASIARKHGVPVLYYISPQIWAWRRGRARKISRLVDHMAVILPFEKAFYEGYRVPVTFVGHPLLDQDGGPDQPPIQTDADSVCGDDGYPAAVGLLPGSRNKEIERHLPVMLAAARNLAEHAPGLKVLVSLAPSLDTDRMAAIIEAGRGQMDVELVPGGADKVYRRCRVAIAVSGTVTLEIALAGTPMVIIYRVSPLSYRLGKALIRVEHIGLMNLIAGRRIVPELIQHEVTAETIADSVWRIFSDPRRIKRIKTDLAAVRRAMGGPGASRRVAQIALEMMRTAKGSQPTR
jgi:lipid-A-disaccharide synthase